LRTKRPERSDFSANDIHQKKRPVDDKALKMAIGANTKKNKMNKKSIDKVY